MSGGKGAGRAFCHQAFDDCEFLFESKGGKLRICSDCVEVMAGYLAVARVERSNGAENGKR